MPRTVSVAITANTSGFTAGMSKVSGSAKTTAGQVKASFASGITGIDKNSASIDKVSGSLAKVGLVAAVGVGAAVKSFADFDQAMSGVKATGSDAAANMTALRDAALKAGADTKYSATEAAGGIEALAKAGVSANDVLSGGLSGSLNLAAAGNLDVAGSAEAAASAMNQFGLSGKDIPHIADLLAEGAGTAQGEVSDMAAALNQSGLIAHQFGLSVDETTQSLALFAKNGLVGSDAGTSFKTMLTALYAPSGTAAKALDQLGVSAYDSAGKIKPIGGLTDELKTKLDALSQGDRNKALKNIFGSDAIRAGTILLKDGSAGLADMATQFGKFGSAADVARAKMDNLSGDVEQLRGSLENDLIKSGSGANSFLRVMTQNATGAANAFGKLPDGAQHAALAVGAIGAAGLLGVAGLLKVATTASGAVTAFQTLSASSPRLGSALSGTAKAAGVLTAALVGLQIAGSVQQKQIDGIALSADSAKTSLQAMASGTSATDALGKSFSGVIDGVDNIGDAFNLLNGNTGFLDKASTKFFDFTSAIAGAQGPTAILSQNFSNLDTQLSTMDPAQAAAAFKQLSASAARSGVTTDQLLTKLPLYAKAMTDTTGATNKQAAAELEANKAYESTRASLQALVTPLSLTSDQSQKLAQSIFSEGDAFQASVNAHSAYEAAIDSTNETLKKNGDHLTKNKQALSDNTAKGRENISALDQLSSSGKAYVQNLVAQGASQAKVKAATAGVRGEFIKAAEGAGLSASAAKKLADSYGLIPKKVSVKFDAFGLALQQQQVEEFKTQLASLPAEQQARIRTIYEDKGAKAALTELDKLNGKTASPRILTKSDVKAVSSKATAFLRSIKDGAPAIKTKSDAQRVTSQAKAFLNSIKDVDPKVLTKKDTRAAAAAKAYLASIKDKPVTVRVSASGVGAAQSAISSIHGHTVIITAKTVKSGGITASALHPATGGFVTGPGGPTDDMIPAMLSNGEFVVRAAAVNKVGLAALHAINAKGYAQGGPVRGYAAGGTVSGATTTEILRLIAALNNPIRDIAVLAAKVTAENRKVRGPQFRYEVALKAYDSAKNRQENLRDRVNQLRKEADATKGTTKADRELKKARSELADANARVSKTSREKTTATSKYNAVAQKSKELTTALKEAQTALADSARQAAETLAGPYRSASLDVDDILESMKQGTVDLTAFQKQISKLRALGLSNTLVQQIVGQGAVRGGEIASQIIDGGKALAATLNTANKNLQTAADQLGYLTVKAPVRKALGGIVSGSGTGTSDSISARLSNGEYVVNAAATAANRGALDAINYGRPQVRNDYLPAFRTGGYVAQPQVSKTFQQGDVIFSGQVVDIDAALRRAKSVQRDSLTMVGLAGGF